MISHYEKKCKCTRCSIYVYRNILGGLDILHDDFHLNTVNACRSPDACIFEHIFADYDPLARPVLNTSTSIAVSVDFFLQTLIDIVS